MKKIFFAFCLLVFLTACTKFNQSTAVIENAANGYQEIKTELTDELIEQNGVGQAINDAMASVSLSVDFWHEKGQLIVSQDKMYPLQADFNCDKGKTQCETLGLLANKDNKPAEFELGDCDEDNMCKVIKPEAPLDLMKKYANYETFGIGQDIYLIAETDQAKQYEIYKNNELLFKRPIYFGASSTVSQASLVLNKPAFTFYDYKGDLSPNSPNVKNNVYYDGEFYNEKYQLDETRNLFGYQDKIGFVAVKDQKYSVYFNGKKISQDFDEIRTYACCAIFAYPFEVYDNGILFFMARRGTEYYLVEIDLNKI
jgi:hypothetical protein